MHTYLKVESCHVFVSRSEYFAGADVHLGDRTADVAGWSGHCEPAGGDRGAAHLTDTRHRADPGHGRRLACPLRYLITHRPIITNQQRTQLTGTAHFIYTIATINQLNSVSKTTIFLFF